MRVKISILSNRKNIVTPELQNGNLSCDRHRSLNASIYERGIAYGQMVSMK
jgi:hypothetical protein